MEQVEAPFLADALGADEDVRGQILLEADGDGDFSHGAGEAGGMAGLESPGPGGVAAHVDQGIFRR